MGPSAQSIMIGVPGGDFGPAPEVTLGTILKTVYVYGRITCKDAFGTDRRTGYRLIFSGKKTTDTRGVLIGMLAHDTEGNDAT